MKFMSLFGVAFLALGIHAEGLSWTDETRDRLCDPKTSAPCAEVKIGQIDYVTAGTKYYLLRYFIMLWAKAQDADELSISTVVETVDHIKHTYRKRVKVETMTDGPELRYCNVELTDPVDKGVVTVWSIDAIEYDLNGKILARHEFR